MVTLSGSRYRLLRGLYMLSANEGWASGASGEIFHFNGSTWNEVSSPTNELLYSIAFSPDEQEGWIVGKMERC